jgi:hypothetical protein
MVLVNHGRHAGKTLSFVLGDNAKHGLARAVAVAHKEWGPLDGALLGAYVSITEAAEIEAAFNEGGYTPLPGPGAIGRVHGAILYLGAE